MEQKVDVEVEQPREPEELTFDILILTNVDLEAEEELGKVSLPRDYRD